MDFATRKEFLEQAVAERKDGEAVEVGAEDGPVVDPLSGDFKIPSESEDEYLKSLEERFKWFPYSPCWDLRSEEPSKLEPKRESCGDSPCECPITLAKKLVQLIFMRIEEYGYSGDAYVYGFVSVRDSVDLLRSYLFRRDENDPQHITFDDYGYAILPMTLPRRTLSAHLEMAFEYDLKILSDDGSEPQELIKGHYLVQPWRVFDGVTFPAFFGKLARLGVKYAVFPHAVEACVEFRFLKLPRSGVKVRLTAPLNVNRMEINQKEEDEVMLFDDFIRWGDVDAKTCVIGIRTRDILQLHFSLGNRRTFVFNFVPAIHGSSTVEEDLSRHTKLSVTASFSPPHERPCKYRVQVPK